MVADIPAEVDNPSGTAIPAATAPVDAPKKDVIRDNGPRLVGATKFIADILLFRSGMNDTGKSYFRAAAAVGFTASRSLLLLFGSKDCKHETAAADTPDKHDTSLAGRLRYNFYKVTHPSQFPVEAGAGVAAAAGVAVMLSGAAQIRNKKLGEGVLELVIGLLTTLAEGNVLFKKEKPKGEALATSEQKQAATFVEKMVQKLKDQPILLSGLTQIVASGSQIWLGLKILARTHNESGAKRNKGGFYLAAGTIYTGADLLYAFLVRKNDFNGEHDAAAIKGAAMGEVTPAPAAQKREAPTAHILKPEHLGMAQESGAVLQSRANA